LHRLAPLRLAKPHRRDDEFLAGEIHRRRA
jgi:hypothetical protein